MVEGEAEVGKIALLRSVNQLRNSSGHFRVMDSAEASPAWFDTIAEELSAGAGSLVVRRAHLLDSDTISALSELLLEYSDQRRGVWVAGG